MSDGFTEWLRSRTDEQLRALAMSRPELITPVPAHLHGLASRASTPSALGRALDRLDRFTLTVAESLSLEPEPTSLPALRATLLASGTPLGPAALSGALDLLRTMALMYGPDDALRLAPGVREALDPPAGLGPPVADVFRHHAPEAIEDLLTDITEAPAAPGEGSPRDRLTTVFAEAGNIRRLLAELSPAAQAALNELAWGPPSGRVPNARREVRVATAQSPIEELLARGLLGATGAESVALPREVAMVLREGRLHREISPEPPPLDGITRDQALADRTAAAQAFTFVRLVEELCELWGADPPGVLRTGGLAVRDLKRTAQRLDVPEWTAAFLAEVAHAAGLIASGGTVDGEWLPTPAYDTWRVRPAENRWAVLATAWLTMDRAPGLAGIRDERDRLVNALHPDLRRSAAAEVRTRTLAVLAAAEPGLAPSTESVLDRLAWERPRRRGTHRMEFTEFTLREAELVGTTGLGVMSGHGRALLTSTPAATAASAATASTAPGAAEVLAPLLPEPVDHVLLQADLTAIAPGPLTSELGRWLGLAADIESKGGATVYRFSEDSIRRVLDAGQSADELLIRLERHSTTPVPQPLRYLVGDVARRHGRLRVGTASAYVRCDDPAVLEEVLADRRAGALRLRRLAPTVLASKTSRATLVDALRAMGYAPVAESLEGDVMVARADTRRAENVPPRPVTGGTGPDPEVAAAAVRAIRAGDIAHQTRTEPRQAPGGALPRSPATATISALQDAIRQGTRVWIGYLDSQGQATSRILEPARMEGGYLTAYDETRAAIHRFALHRITGVADVN
ncbi:helicase-associated domain-containing protein [Acrocarpospora catenulata]|uniref:helicase-associated domain-containing protein n=1 Tax=Acrocarpospora catenulata TaxID=2836182 RepID=UPI001BD9E87D|nr:helicase C-terminal domain-containing protein [Acrocarpospora catenulata]